MPHPAPLLPFHVLKGIQLAAALLAPVALAALVDRRLAALCRRPARQ